MTGEGEGGGGGAKSYRECKKEWSINYSILSFLTRPFIVIPMTALLAHEVDRNFLVSDRRHFETDMLSFH